MVKKNQGTAARGDLQTIDIHGKPYVTVAERVKAVTTLVSLEENRYEIESWERFAVNDRHFLTCNIIVGFPSKKPVHKETPDWKIYIDDGRRRYSGTAEINFGGKGVDATSPYENAETSALGRALAFAGVGLIDGIASADEVTKAGGDTGVKKITPKQVTYMETLWLKTGQPTNIFNRYIKDMTSKDTIDDLTTQQASEVIDDLQQTVRAKENDESPSE